MENQARFEVLARSPQKRISDFRRFALLVLGSFGCICCSFSYAFNLVAPSMKTRYNFTQRDMSTISTVGLVFQYFVIPYAFLYDYIGPLPISILATIYFALGTLLLAQCFAGNIGGSVVRLSVFNALMSSGCGLFDLACCMTVLSYFPTNKGPVVALLKTYTGLGSAIVGCLKLGYFGDDVEAYFYFLMALAIVVGVLCIIFIRLPEYHLTQYQQSHLSPEEKEKREAIKTQYLKQKAPMWRFVYGFIILFFLIVYLPMESALVSYLGLGRNAMIAFAVVATVVTLIDTFVAFPARVPCLEKEEQLGDTQEEALSVNDTEGETQDVDVMNIEVGKGRSNTNGRGEPIDDEKKQQQRAVPAVVETEIDYIAPQYQTTFLQNLLTVRLWALFWTFFAVVGAEFVIIFNASFLFGALDGKMPDSSMSTLLTVLNGVGSAVGRLLMSYFEVWTQKRKAEDRIPITIALFFPTGSIIITIILFLTLPGRALPLPYVIAALGNGFLAATLVLVMRTIYAKDVAKHYNFCFLASMASSIALNKFLYGEWYAVQADKQNRSDNLCFGKKCVLMPMCVLLGLACTAFISNVYIHFSYRNYCREVLAERAKLREEAIAAENAEEFALEDGMEAREGEGDITALRENAAEMCSNARSSLSDAHNAEVFS